jgi:multidrug efflux pump subunit AcrA (membrane-fusion protein)
LLLLAITLITFGALGIQKNVERTTSSVLIVTGTLEPDRSMVSTRIPGKLLQFDVAEGQPVNSGQLVAELDPKELTDQLHQAQLASVARTGWLGVANTGMRPLEVKVDSATFAAAAPKAPLESNSKRDAKVKAAKDSAEALVAYSEDSYQQALSALRVVQSGAPKAELDAAAIAVSQAKTVSDKAQDHYEKWKALFAEGAISGHAYDDAKSASDRAQATTDAATAKLKALQAGPDPSLLARAQASVADAQRRRDDAVRSLATTNSAIPAKPVPAPPVQAPQINSVEAQAPIFPPSMMISGSLKSTHASREAAQKTAIFIQSLLGQTKIYAPADGVVTKENTLSGTQLQAGTPILTISSPDRLWITVRVPTDKAERLTAGDLVEVLPSRSGAAGFLGHVFAVEAINGIYSAMDVRILIDHPSPELKPGTNASVMLRIR